MIRSETAAHPNCRFLGAALVLLVCAALAIPTEARVPARLLPGDAAISAAAKDQSAPFLAQGGSTVLAVWSDNRANSTGGYEGETSRDIYGMRFDGAGNALDAVPFPIATGRASQELPRAAWNGSHWLVVFESYDVGGTGYYQKSLEAVRVATNGQVVDARPIRIVNDTPVGGTWAVASDGAQWVIVNQGTSASGDLVASRISAAGVLLDPGPKSLVPATYYLRGGLRLAYAGGVFLLAYEESMTGSDPTTALRFDATLHPLDPAPYGLLGSTIRGLAANGGGFYAVWNEQLPDFTMAVKGSRIGTDGKLKDPGGVVLSGTHGPVGSETTVTWDGQNWKASWAAADGTRVARVSSTGQVLDPGGVLIAANVKAGGTASAGNGSLQVVWSEFVVTNADVFTANVSASNVGGATRTVSTGAPSQMRPDIAMGGNGSMVVYRSSTSARNRVLAQPLDAAGNPLTAEPVELASADGTEYPGYPAVAWNGSLYLVTWNEATSVVARRIRPDGSIVDAAPITVLSSAFGPTEVEALGGDFLVVGFKCGISCQYIFPVGARVRGSDGAVLDTSPISFNGTYSSSVRLAVLGGRWLLVYQDNASHDDCMASTVATFVDASGAKGASFSVHGPYSSCGGNGISSVGLASSGNVALMVQSQELTSGVETDLLMRRIHPDGSVDPMVNLTPWQDDQYRPRVAWDGTHFIVTWQDQRTALATNGLEQLDARSDLMGMRITEAGAVVDPQGFVFSNSELGEAYPVVAAANGVTLFAASIIRNEAPLVNYRIGYELFGSGGNKWPSPRFTAAPSGGDVPVGVTFNSAGTTDLDGAVASYAWNFGDGATSTEPNPSHVYAAAGPFVATLTVTDNAGAAAMQEARIMAVAANLAPVAVASSNLSHGLAPLDVTFYATGSYDPDGFIGNIKWSFPDDGSEYWGATAYHTFQRAGTWPVTLTVYDASNATGSTTLTITIDPPTLPLAPSGCVATAYSPDYVSVNWTDNSTNEDGFRVERCTGTSTFCAANPAAWAQITETGPGATVYSDQGLASMTTYTYRVRAFNVTGPSPYSNTSTTTTLSLPPVAVAAPSVMGGPAPLAVTFDGRGSYDADGTITRWDWNFGDGGTATGATATHTFVNQGYAYVHLTVTDNTGATGDTWVTINVVSGSSRSPAQGDAGTTLGAIFSGSFLDTQTQNNVAEVLIEGQTAGTPQTRKSQLEHKWSLNVAAGSGQTFWLDAWHSPNTEGDDFVFEYSRDNATWTPMVTVTKTSDNSTLQSYAFPGDVTGPLWVRVRDLDRTAGRGQTDKVYIDEMFITSSLSAGRVGEVGAAGRAPGGWLLVSKAPFSQLNLTWGTSCVATDDDYAIYQGRLGDFRSHVPQQCSTGGFASATIATPPGNVYFLVVPHDGLYEGRYGTSSSGTEIPAGPTRCWPAAVAVGCP